MSVPDFRVGQGFDVHRFSTDPERPMILGGCHFDGVHFPDTDERWRGADSMALLRHVTAMLAEDGWRAANIDCAIVCEQPKIAPYRDEMQRNLTAAVGAPVTVKGNRAEQLGAIGRSEGVVCFATALIHRPGGRSEP